MKFTETQIGTIGAISVRWPPETASPMWKALHNVVEMCRSMVTSLDVNISEINADKTLSDIGRVQKIGSAGKMQLGQLLDLDLPDLKGATAAVNAFVAKQEEGALALQRKAGPATSDDLLGQEIRAFVRKQQHPSSFAFRYRSDPRVFVAITGAPAFLSGLSDEEAKTYQGSAASAIWPEQVRAKQEALSALDAAEKAVRSAEAKMLELASAGLMKTGPGQYALKSPTYSTPKNGTPRRVA